MNSKLWRWITFGLGRISCSKSGYVALRIRPVARGRSSSLFAGELPSPENAIEIPITRCFRHRHCAPDPHNIVGLSVVLAETGGSPER